MNYTATEGNKMFADVTVTIPTEAIHAAAWFVIGATTMLVGLFSLEIRARKRVQTAENQGK